MQKIWLTFLGNCFKQNNTDYTIFPIRERVQNMTRQSIFWKKYIGREDCTEQRGKIFHKKQNDRNIQNWIAANWKRRLEKKFQVGKTPFVVFWRKVYEKLFSNRSGRFYRKPLCEVSVRTGTGYFYYYFG